MKCNSKYTATDFISKMRFRQRFGGLFSVAKGPSFGHKHDVMRSRPKKFFINAKIDLIKFCKCPGNKYLTSIYLLDFFLTFASKSFSYACVWDILWYTVVCQSLSTCWKITQLCSQRSKFICSLCFFTKKMFFIP